jgi:hypothetical protein
MVSKLLEVVWQFHDKDGQAWRARRTITDYDASTTHDPKYLARQ